MEGVDTGGSRVGTSGESGSVKPRHGKRDIELSCHLYLLLWFSPKTLSCNCVYYQFTNTYIYRYIDKH